MGEIPHAARGFAFSLSWIGVFVFAAAIVMTGVDPVAVVEYSIVFAVVILPLTYLPMLLIAQDRRVMHSHANGRFASVWAGAISC